MHIKVLVERLIPSARSYHPEDFIHGNRWIARYRRNMPEQPKCFPLLLVLANEKVDRALRAGALAVGGKVRITTLPDYLHMISDPTLQELYRSNAISVVGEKEVSQLGHSTWSSDMGDVSHIMPAIQPSAGGATGISHGSDYLIQDYELAILNPAKAMVMLVIDLLADGAAKAGEVLSRSKPRMTKQEYLALMEGLFKEEEYEG